jgi:hypothetical protein
LHDLTWQQYEPLWAPANQQLNPCYQPVAMYGRTPFQAGPTLVHYSPCFLAVVAICHVICGCRPIDPQISQRGGAWWPMHCCIPLHLCSCSSTSSLCACKCPFIQAAEQHCIPPVTLSLATAVRLVQVLHACTPSISQWGGGEGAFRRNEISRRAATQHHCGSEL